MPSFFEGPKGGENKKRKVCASQRPHRATWASNTRARSRRAGHARDKCLYTLFAEMECCLARSWLCAEKGINVLNAFTTFSSHQRPSLCQERTTPPTRSTIAPPSTAGQGALMLLALALSSKLPGLAAKPASRTQTLSSTDARAYRFPHPPLS